MQVNGHRMTYLDEGGMICRECFSSVRYPEDRDPETGKLLYLYVYGRMKEVKCEASTPEFPGMDVNVTTPAAQTIKSAYQQASRSKDLNRRMRK